MRHSTSYGLGLSHLREGHYGPRTVKTVAVWDQKSYPGVSVDVLSHRLTSLIPRLYDVIV